MVEKNQQFIYNSDELSLIKNTFAENDTLLYTIRKVFLQFPLTETEAGLIKTAVTPEVMAILKKRMLPDLHPDYPLGQIPSLMTTLTDQLKVKDVDEMEAQFAAKEVEETYLRQQFEALQAVADGEEVAEPEISLEALGQLGDKTKEEAFVEMNAYLFLLGYIDPMLILIKAIAGEKNETVEQQKQRMTRDSAK